VHVSSNRQNGWQALRDCSSTIRFVYPPISGLFPQGNSISAFARKD